MGLSMITRTEHGYALGNWEGIPMRLPTKELLTPREVQAATCRINGLNAEETGREMGIKANSVHQIWKVIYFKLHMARSDAVVAINKLIDAGALHRLGALFLAFLIGYTAIVGDDDEMLRPRGSLRTTTRLARVRNNKMVEIGGYIA